MCLFSKNYILSKLHRILYRGIITSTPGRLGGEGGGGGGARTEKCVSPAAA